MPMLDAFNNNAFSMQSLTASINTLPVQPGRIGQLGVFMQRPITTTVATIEYKHHTLRVIPNAARGSRENANRRPARNAYEFQCAHLPQDSRIEADDVQDVRAFGSETQLETLAQAVNEQLQNHRDDHETTHEWHRMGAISGQLLDDDGSVLHDYFARFGVTPTVIAMTLATSDVMEKATEIIRAVRAAMGGTPYSGIHAFCGDSFWDALVKNQSVKDGYNRFQDGRVLRENQVYNVFPFGGIDWENYYGDIGGSPWIATDRAKIVIKGARDVYQHSMAPANFAETVNTRGRNIYAKQKMADFDMGVDLHSQSNPLMICTRPAVCIELTEA